MAIQFLPPETAEEKAARKLRYRAQQAVLQFVGDCLARERALNHEAGQDVNFSNEELEHVSAFNHKLIMEA